MWGSNIIKIPSIISFGKWFCVTLSRAALQPSTKLR